MEPAVQSGPDMFAFSKKWVALGFGLVACASGSSAREPFTATDDPQPAEPVTDETSAEPTPEPQAQAEAKAPDKPAAKDDDPAPAPECPNEQEPNNQADQATPFTSCIKGELSGWTDTDNLVITVPEGAAEMDIDHINPDGVIQYSVTSGGGQGGSSNMSFSDQAPKTKVKPGTKYTFTLKWDNNGQGAVDDKRSYAIRVAFLH